MRAGAIVSPNGKTEDLAGGGVDNDPGIAASILLLRQAAVDSHIHDDALSAPGAPAIRAAKEPDVDVFLQIATRAAAHVVDAQQRALWRRGQGWNSVSVNSILPMTAQSNADSVGT